MAPPAGWRGPGLRLLLSTVANPTPGALTPTGCEPSRLKGPDRDHAFEARLVQRYRLDNDDEDRGSARGAGERAVLVDPIFLSTKGDGSLHLIAIQHGAIGLRYTYR
jgi:hypothetical protein